MDQQTTSDQAEHAALDKEYRAYIEKLQIAWLAHNRMSSRDVLEVMRPEERAEVDRRIAVWIAYVTPLGEAWWAERGWGVIWPTDNSEPMKVYKL